MCGPARDWQKFKRLRDQIMYGLKYGPKLRKPLRIEKNKNGNTRSHNSTMLDDWEESSLLIWMTMNTKKPCGHAVQKGATGNWLRRWLHLTRFQRPTMVVLWNPSNPTRNEWNLPSLPKTRLSHSKGFIYFEDHYNLVHKFIPMPQAMKILDATGSVEKEWKKLDTIPSWQLDKVRSKKEVILEAQKVKRKVHFATLMDICHSKTLS